MQNKKSLIDIDSKEIDFSLSSSSEKNFQEAEMAKICLENIITNFPEPIYWLDKNSVIMGCSIPEAKLFGFNNPDKLIGKSIFDIAQMLQWPTGVAENLRQNDEEVIHTKKGKFIEENDISPDGRLRTFMSHKSPLLDSFGNAVGIIGVSVDISERKHFEHELKQQKEYAETISQTIKIFAESMAHELRTPLAAISGYSFGIKKYLPILFETYKLAKQANLTIPSIRPEHFSFLSKLTNNMEAEINHANMIVDMLLLKSNPNKLDLVDLEKLSIIKCVKHAITRYPYKTKIEHSLVKLNRTNDFDFLGEELFTMHVVMNLLKNALYHITIAGKGEIHIWTHKRRSYNELHFKDTAKGISAENLLHIFDLYFSNTKHGTGIGLAFCKQVMQGFGGDIECQSQEGEFTEFILKFPIVN